MAGIQNDGSFLAKFLAQQQQQQQGQQQGQQQQQGEQQPAPTPVPQPEPGPVPVPLTNDGSFLEKFLASQAAAGASAGGAEQAASSIAEAASGAPAANATARTLHGRQMAVRAAKPAPTGREGVEEQQVHSHADGAIPENIKKKIDNCANWVAEQGDSFAQILRAKNQDNPNFRFLLDDSTPEAAYYRKVLAAKRAVLADGTGAADSEGVASGGGSGSSRAISEPRRKRTRWGAGTSASAAPLPAAAATERTAAPMAPIDPVAAARAAAQAVAARLAAVPSGVSNTAPSATGKRRFSETAGAPIFQPTAAVVPAQPRVKSDLDKSNAGMGVVPVPDLNLYGDVIKYKDARDTLDDARDGPIEGGTWEHRARAREMADTAAKAAMLTLAARQKAGKAHHVGDHLPEDKLAAFLAKCKAVVSEQGTATKEGAAAAQALNDYSANTLGADNVGFQMLKGLGWTQGTGLGAKGNGIAAPVGVAGAGTGAGIGMAQSTEVEAGDDAFAQYRKRMQLAYRFRPNPNNNPRRAYDGYATL